MSASLRMLLIFGAVLVCMLVVSKLKKAQIQILDSLFWLLFSASFVLLGFFPEIAIYLASSLGFVSASNFVFLYVIAVLVVRDFYLTIRLSKQEERLNALAQSVALGKLQ